MRRFSEEVPEGGSGGSVRPESRLASLPRIFTRTHHHRVTCPAESVAGVSAPERMPLWLPANRSRDRQGTKTTPLKTRALKQNST